MLNIDLTGKVALVTGAAQGIGRAISRMLAEAGARVWLTDLLEESLAEAVAAAGGDSHSAGVADLTDSAAVTQMVTRVLAEAGQVDILVHVAGGVVGQIGQPIEAITDAAWDAIVKANLFSAFYTIRAVTPPMKAQGGGRIVIISSGAGRSVSLTGIQAYASAKAGQLGLTRQMAHELGPHGITVNAIAPGFVRSNPATERQWAALGAAGQANLVESIALRRIGTPDDIAAGVLFFVSDLSRWITGQTLSIDGGRHMV